MARSPTGFYKIISNYFLSSLVLLPILPQYELAEVWVVDQSVIVDLVGHVYHLLLPGIQTQSLHGIQGILGRIEN